jgi:hypothetical protein
MPAPDEKKGKTLWEMLQERIHGHGNGNGATLAFGNPLDLRVGSPLRMAFANGPEFANYDFTVQEIREYLRRIGGQDFSFTDYVLRGVNTKSFDADEVLTARVRVVPNQAGGRDSLLLRLSDEFAFAEDFLGVVKDTTGTFEVKDDKTDATETFTRINNLRESYEAAVMVVSETTADGKAPPGKTSSVKLEYWDYWRDVEIGAGKTAKEFLFVEMNSDTGWFQIWRGREFFT